MPRRRRCSPALERPGCILLVDEVEKAHPDLLRHAPRSARRRSPAEPGRPEHRCAPHRRGADDERRRARSSCARLGRTPLADRWAVQRACADHLRELGIPPDLVGRIGAFAAYGDLDGGKDARQGIAESAIRSLGREYGLVVADGRSGRRRGRRGHRRAGQRRCGRRTRACITRPSELLAECFAELAGDRPRQRVDDRGRAAASGSGRRRCRPSAGATAQASG